ncbi:GIY-YIG nuclease family protein [Sphingomonas sp. SE158]|uniref:GIY-YIG nuclease family protein n=1 Tax=Sphingomonas alba TaxID=2908208 RepID=A0ABT0RK00_9SPHN|nr:GIY-YIG nuclease family protein [Sphingomonas alba]MCL6682930.1 GIY-YIG nuclease family protein [Sphingomonas alba]
MQFWAYLLKCSDGSFYAGHTDNLEVRLAQHQAGEGLTGPAVAVRSSWFGPKPRPLVMKPLLSSAGSRDGRVQRRRRWLQGTRGVSIYLRNRPWNALRLRSGRARMGVWQRRIDC